MGRHRGCAVAALAVLLWGCGKPDARPVGRAVEIAVPLGLPPLAIPADNPPTAETIALGKKLFFSPLLSRDGNLSCANCHDPRHGFADPMPVSTGTEGKRGKRNAPTVENAAYQPLQFWDGRAAGLEEQAAGPMMNPVEMAHSVAGLEKRCGEDAGLRGMFTAAFGAGPVSLMRITRALASYERTLLVGNSPFDRYFYGREQDAMSEAALRGLTVFRETAKGNCTACHTMGEKSALFTDGKFHNLGVGLSPDGELTDLGRYTVTHRKGDQGAFRTPSLRNVARTAPYMHDGSLKTLRDVVNFYVGGGSSNPYRDPELKPLTHLSGQERADLVAFLEALSGEVK